VGVGLDVDALLVDGAVEVITSELLYRTWITFAQMGAAPLV
jgi:hypothetical protein